MNRTSRLVKKDSNTHASRLIKSMQNITGSSDAKMPNGVFGSVAIIKCNGATISSENLDIEFQVPF